MTLYMLASRESNMVPSFLQGPACLQNCNNKFLTLFPPSHLFVFLSCHNLISRNKMHYYSKPKKGTMAKQGCQRCRSFCKGMQKIMGVFIRISIKNVSEEVGKLAVKEGKRRNKKARSFLSLLVFENIYFRTPSEIRSPSLC